jgi:hypothetical protein
MNHRDLQNWEPTGQDMRLAGALGIFFVVLCVWVSTLLPANRQFRICDQFPAPTARSAALI